MSRAGTADVVTVKPANNVYTVLALISFLIVIAALLALYVRANDLFGPGGLLS
jgi:NADH:ubiquinone oxidoreductase subunit 6 (subunit J)